MLRFALLALVIGVAGCDGTTGTLVKLVGAEPDSSPTAAPHIDAGAVSSSPLSATAWQIQLSGTLDTTIDVGWYEVDFDTDASTIAALHARGRTVSCYVSAGTDEAWRDDSADFPASAVGNALSDYSREHWVDVRDATVRSVNQRRLSLARTRGCDGVELSNIQGHTVDSGFPLTAADDLAYARFLLGVAHGEGLTAGVSSDDLVGSLAPEMDWGLTEECLSYGTCDAWRTLVDAHKAVFMIEYGSAVDAPVLCPQAAALGFSLVIKRSSLDAFRVGCGLADGGQ
ncbi:MAG TPA: endo alpha-1,4 polygalactosaminidase [Polyangiaceae bacterium]|jgi:hypothetical protein|nr:endo alpha-1,4 polygalactosaminidase [Polyangiaceae bacterium]